MSSRGKLMAIVLFAMVVSGLPPDEAAADVVYGVEDVTPPFATEGVLGASVNDRGTVGASYWGAGDWHAYTWHNGYARDLSWPAWPDGGLSDYGRIAGRVDAESGAEKASLWDNGVIFDLHSLGAGWGVSWALAVNKSGLVVGYGGPDAGGYPCPASAFIYTASDVFVEKGVSPTWLESWFYDVNDDGAICGHVDAHNDPVLGEGGGIVWSDGNGDNAVQSNEVKLLTDMTPHLINNDLDVVCKVWGSDNWVLWDWDDATLIKPLPDTNTSYTHPTGFNDLGEVVFNARKTDGTSYAALWDGTSAVDIDDLLPPGFVGHVSRVWDINNHGQMVTGSYLLTPIPVLTPELTGGATADISYDPYDNAGGYAAGLPAGGQQVGGTAELGNFTLADTFGTLALAYDEADLVYQGIVEATLRLYWYDDGLEEWMLAGNESNLTYNPSAQFVEGAPTGVLGDWGIDVAGNYVWANIDHASTYGMSGVPIPLPGAVVLGILGVFAVGAARRRAKK